jgi:ferredoxin-NADP reductase
VASHDRQPPYRGEREGQDHRAQRAGWEGHVAGQNLDVRLTAEDGYQAERSYAIASAPESAKVALTVARIDDGKVSSHLTGARRVAELELRGPIGGPFTSRLNDIHRLAREVLYRSELMRLAAGDGLAVHRTFTHDPPAAWSSPRRLDADMLKASGAARARRPRIFVCGPTAFVGRAPTRSFSSVTNRNGSRSMTLGRCEAHATSRPSADDSTSSRRGRCARLELRPC